MRFVTTNAPILFYTDGDTGKNARLIINSEGNVGVGTASPAKADLHLGAGNDMLRIGAVNFRGKAKNRSQYGLERSRNQILFSTYSGDQKDKIGAKIAAVNKQTWHESRRRHYNQSTDLVFYTVPPDAVEHDATQERLRITDSGRIGIGTSSPEASLHIDGNLRIGHWEIVDTGVLELRTEGGTRIRLGPDLFDNILAQQEKIEELTEKVKLLEKKLG